MRIKQRVSRVSRTPAFGVAVLTPVVLAGAVAATPVRPANPMNVSDVTPIAAVEPAGPDFHGTTVVPVTKPPADFKFGANTLSVPPPAAVVSAVGGLRIPAIALAAYRKAEQTMAVASPNCGVSWNLLAGIGRIESSHANGGATDSHGTALRPIYGPALDGSLPGNEVIVQGNAGGRPIYARAVGPMQFLPGTWARFASDGKGDGKPDPQNIFDASLATARYLCSGGLNLRNQAQVLTAILRYNNSMAYAQNVMGWAAAYATGVAPVDLPPITGPIPALGDAHMDHPQGLGPGMPGMLPGDPLAELTASLGNSQMAGQMMMPGPGADSVLPEHGCEVICMASQLAPPSTENLPPWMQQMPWAAPGTPPPWMAPPAEATSPMPGQGLGTLPGPGAGPAPGPMPAQAPGPMPAQAPGPMPAQAPGPMPAQAPAPAAESAPPWMAPPPAEPAAPADAPQGQGALPGPAS